MLLHVHAARLGYVQAGGDSAERSAAVCTEPNAACVRCKKVLRLEGRLAELEEELSGAQGARAAAEAELQQAHADAQQTRVLSEQHVQVRASTYAHLDAGCLNSRCDQPARVQ